MQRQVRTELSAGGRIGEAKQEVGKSRKGSLRFHYFSRREYVHTRDSDGTTGPTHGSFSVKYRIDCAKEAEKRLDNAVSFGDLRAVKRVLSEGHVTKKAAREALKKARKKAKDAAAYAIKMSRQPASLMRVELRLTSDRFLAEQKKFEAVASALEQYVASPRAQLAVPSD